MTEVLMVVVSFIAGAVVAAAVVRARRRRAPVASPVSADAEFDTGRRSPDQDSAVESAFLSGELPGEDRRAPVHVHNAGGIARMMGLAFEGVSHLVTLDGEVRYHGPSKATALSALAQIADRPGESAYFVDGVRQPGAAAPDS